MREFGKIITRKTDLTDAQVQEKYKFPAIIILHDNEDQILKITHYQKNGTKTIYDFSLSASKQFVTDSIATAIAGLQDNRLEFNEFSDFPAIGDETKFYIDLTEDKIYIWDAYSQTYKNQSWDTATIASIHASIASAQMAFQNLENSKLDKPTLFSSGNVPKWNSTSNNFVGGSIYNADDGKIGISNTNPIEMFDVGGRTKSDGQVFNETTSAILPREIKFKDGKFKAALADGVEKAIAFEGNNISSNLLQRIVTNANRELYISSIDYVNGIITTTQEHGLPINSYIGAAGFPNSFKLGMLDLQGWKSIPYEYVLNFKMIKPIDSNRLQVCNSSGTAITNVSPTSTENNGNLDISKWHIEIPTSSVAIDLPFNNYKNFRINYNGLFSHFNGSLLLSMVLYRSDGTYFTNSSDISVAYLGNRNVITPGAAVSSAMFYVAAKHEFSIYSGTNAVFMWNQYINRTGNNIFNGIVTSQFNASGETRMLYVNDLSHGLKTIQFNNYNNIIANGTIIELYIQ